ncbi:cupin domain-containing protein [Pelagibacterium xiamenense]|uniref:cupin domain-containing protein n=1 Tax=Pelagibacterium xiamenense TaxID=2901140 RepID=UPI001E417B1C|nr:cupin domain-containing protein [Pelagibacterium xiamenense]MCD7060711.1 cupin domain-containing protein [Pelagibacterium xiamenense]
MTEDAPLAVATVQEDNERVRVTRWQFAPGTQTGWHTHEADYVVVPVIGGTLTMVNPDGSETESTITAGEAYFRRAGVHHTVVNRTDAPVEFVETELK